MQSNGSSSYNLLSDDFDPVLALNNPENVRIPVKSAPAFDTLRQCQHLLPPSDPNYRPQYNESLSGSTKHQYDIKRAKREQKHAMNARKQQAGLTSSPQSNPNSSLSTSTHHGEGLEAVGMKEGNHVETTTHQNSLDIHHQSAVPQQYQSRGEQTKQSGAADPPEMMDNLHLVYYRFGLRLPSSICPHPDYPLTLFKPSRYTPYNKILQRAIKSACLRSTPHQIISDLMLSRPGAAWVRFFLARPYYYSPSSYLATSSATSSKLSSISDIPVDIDALSQQYTPKQLAYLLIHTHFKRLCKRHQTRRRRPKAPCTCTPLPISPYTYDHYMYPDPQYKQTSSEKQSQNDGARDNTASSTGPTASTESLSSGHTSHDLPIGPQRFVVCRKPSQTRRTFRLVPPPAHLNRHIERIPFMFSRGPLAAISDAVETTQRIGLTISTLRRRKQALEYDLTHSRSKTSANKPDGPSYTTSAHAKHESTDHHIIQSKEDIEYREITSQLSTLQSMEVPKVKVYVRGTVPISPIRLTPDNVDHYEKAYMDTVFPPSVQHLLSIQKMTSDSSSNQLQGSDPQAENIQGRTSSISPTHPDLAAGQPAQPSQHHTPPPKTDHIYQGSYFLPFLHLLDPRTSSLITPELAQDIFPPVPDEIASAMASKQFSSPQSSRLFDPKEYLYQSLYYNSAGMGSFPPLPPIPNTNMHQSNDGMSKPPLSSPLHSNYDSNAHPLPYTWTDNATTGLNNDEMVHIVSKKALNRKRYREKKQFHRKLIASLYNTDTQPGNSTSDGKAALQSSINQPHHLLATGSANQARIALVSFLSTIHQTPLFPRGRVGMGIGSILHGHIVSADKNGNTILRNAIEYKWTFLPFHILYSSIAETLQAATQHRSNHHHTRNGNDSRPYHGASLASNEPESISMNSSLLRAIEQMQMYSQSVPSCNGVWAIIPRKVGLVVVASHTIILTAVLPPAPM